MENLELNIGDLLELEGMTQDFGLLPHRRIHGLLIGQHSSELRGRGLDFSEVRKYVAGDDIRNIDWNVTARTQKTHTKVFTEEKERPQLIILDQSKRMLFGSDVQLKINRGLQLATIHAFRALRMGDRVAIWTFNDSRHIINHLSSSKNALAGIIYETLTLNHDTLRQNPISEKEEKYTLSQLLELAVEKVSHDYIIQVISDFMLVTNEDIENITILSEKNDVIISHISDPLDQQLPKGKMELTDGKMQVSIKSNKTIENSYQDSYLQKISSLKDKFEEIGVPFLTFTTTKTIHDQITDILKH